jgi:carboxymethylenebutenolidase
MSSDSGGSAATVQIATTSGGMAAYDARPAGAPVGGVIVIQEAFGVTPHIEDVARRFAAAGYRTVAPHLFYRTGDPVLSYDNLEEIWPHLKELRADAILDDLDAALSYLEDTAGLASARVAVVGFCMGGSVTALAAARRRVGAAVSFYGGGVAEGRFGMPPLLELAQGFVTPWLGLYGGQDEGIPVEQAEALRDAAKQAAVSTDLVLYPEAAHGFHCDARAKSYHQPSAKDAWQRTIGWLGEHLPEHR